MQSFEQLKTHCSKLESAIASLESANVQVTSQTQQESLARERDVDELRSRVKTLETSLHKEKHLNKDMKLQVSVGINAPSACFERCATFRCFAAGE